MLQSMLIIFFFYNITYCKSKKTLCIFVLNMALLFYYSCLLYTSEFDGGNDVQALVDAGYWLDGHNGTSTLTSTTTGEVKVYVFLKVNFTRESICPNVKFTSPGSVVTSAPVVLSACLLYTSYEFSYKFISEDGKERKLMIEDWELGMLYWNCLAAANGNRCV